MNTRKVVLFFIILMSFAIIRPGPDQVKARPNNLDDLTMLSVVSSPALPNVLFATFKSSDTWLPPRYSTDGGYTWQEVNTTPWISWSATDLNLEVSLAPRGDLSHPVRYLVAASGSEYQPPSVWGTALGVYRTGDEGQTWFRQPVPGELSVCLYSWSVAYTNFVISPADPHQLFVTYVVHGFFSCPPDPWPPPPDFYADWGGVLRSTDNGVTWDEILTWDWSTTPNIVKIIPSPILAGRLYAYGSNGFTQSNDGGDTWVSRSFPISTLVLDSINSLILYGYGTGGGMTSINRGNSWVPWREQPCAGTFEQLMASSTQSGFLFMRCAQGLYRSYDRGNAWQLLSPSSGEFIQADYGNPGRILWLKEDGLWASDNDGASWFLLSAGFDQPHKHFLPLIIAGTP